MAKKKARPRKTDSEIGLVGVGRMGANIAQPLDPPPLSPISYLPEGRPGWG